MTDFQTMTCKASVWPHRHRNEGYGPLDLRISYRNQPDVLKYCLPDSDGERVWFSMEQPDERTNLTLIRLSLGYRKVNRENGKWYRTRYHMRTSSRTISIYLKARVTNSLDHPVPVGRWDGTCEYGDDWCMFTFQAVSLRVKPEESRIIVP